MPIAVDIDVMLARRKMSVGELADRVGITPANLAVLKNGRAKAVRFTTLAALCEVLECQPGDVLRWEAEDAGADDVPRAAARHEPGPPLPGLGSFPRDHSAGNDS
jgi:putative transcriptional regulator